MTGAAGIRVVAGVIEWSPRHSAGPPSVYVGTDFDVDVRARLASLQTAASTRLHLLGVQGGAGREGERALHERFAADRLQGEWFAPSDALLALAGGAL